MSWFRGDDGSLLSDYMNAVTIWVFFDHDCLFINVYYPQTWCTLSLYVDSKMWSAKLYLQKILISQRSTQMWGSTQYSQLKSARCRYIFHIIYGQHTHVNAFLGSKMGAWGYQKFHFRLKKYILNVSFSSLFPSAPGGKSLDHLIFKTCNRDRKWHSHVDIKQQSQFVQEIHL